MELWKNKKNGCLYEISPLTILNCTNAQDGQEMVMYFKYRDYSCPTFVRERKEFFEKFEKVEEANELSQHN